MASDDPVLPPVYSMTRIPGLSTPRASAPVTIASASRSLYEPVGLMYSNFTRTSALPGGVSLLSLTTGVLPIASSTQAEVCIGVTVPPNKSHHCKWLSRNHRAWLDLPLRDSA